MGLRCGADGEASGSPGNICKVENASIVPTGGKVLAVQPRRVGQGTGNSSMRRSKSWMNLRKTANFAEILKSGPKNSVADQQPLYVDSASA